MAKELTETMRKKLQKIKNTHGAQNQFVKKAKVRPETIDRLLKEGTAHDKVMERIETALIEETAPLPANDREASEKIMDLVAADYKMTMDRIKKPETKEEIEARKVLVFILDKETRLSKSGIAALTGYKDHTTISDTLNSISDRMDTEPAFRHRVNTLRKKA